MQIDKREAAIFLTINLFAPLLYFWTLWRFLGLWPFWSDFPERGLNNLAKLTLSVTALVFIANIWRFFARPSWRLGYGTITVLNLITLFGTANLAFLMSLDDIHFMLTNLLRLL